MAKADEPVAAAADSAAALSLAATESKLAAAEARASELEAKVAELCDEQEELLMCLAEQDQEFEALADEYEVLRTGTPQSAELANGGGDHEPSQALNGSPLTDLTASLVMPTALTPGSGPTPASLLFT